MATEDIVKAADKSAAAQLKQINMVTSNISKLKAEVNQKITSVEKRQQNISSIQGRNLSKLTGDVTTMNRMMGKQGAEIKNIGQMKGVREVQSNLNSMLKSMGRSVEYLAQGVKKTTTETARITKETVGQYGKAISEDISINKQNVVAMAMAKTSPIFGYFASKFMETEVFRTFTDRIKGKFKEAFSAVSPMFKGMFRQLGEKVKDLRYAFGRKPKIEFSEESQRSLGYTASTVRGYGEKVEKLKNRKKIPKLQEGGVVAKTGIAKIHKGEVVMPMDQLLKMIDTKVAKSTDAKLVRTFISGLTMMGENMAKVENYVARDMTDRRKERTGIVQDFIRSYQKAKDVKSMKWQDRLLRATLELKVALVGSTDRLKLAWHETLIKHPTFRNIIAAGHIFRKAVSFPFKILFAAKGGYMGEIRKVTRGKNVFTNILGALSLMYTSWSSRFEFITDSLRDMRKMSQEDYERKMKDKKVTTGIEQLQKWLTKEPDAERKTTGQKLFEAYANSLGLDKKVLDEVGIKSFKDLATPGKILEKAGISKEQIQEKVVKEYVPDWLRKGYSTVRERFKKETPHLQEGGIIRKTGKIIAHKGEIVMPVKQVFEMIGTFAASTKELTKKLDPLTKLKGVLADFKTTVAENKRLKTTKTPFKFARGLAEEAPSRFGLRMMKFYEKALQKKHEIWEKRTWKRSEKTQQKSEKRQKKHDTFMEKKLIGHHKSLGKFYEKTEKRTEKFYSKSETNRERNREKQETRETKWQEVRRRIREKFERKVARMHEWQAIKSVRGQNKIFRRGQKDIAKDHEKANQKILKFQQKMNARSEKQATTQMKRHDRVLGFYRRLHNWQAKKEERRQKRMEKAQDRLAKKREKMAEKIEKIKAKTEKEKLKYQRKLEAAKAKAQTRAARRLEKVKIKVEVAKAKQEARKRRVQDKIELQRQRVQMKKDRKTAKIKMKLEAVKMKEETKKLKEQLKRERKQLKEDLKKVKQEARQAKKEQWAGRWKRVLDFPNQVMKFRKDAADQTKKQLNLAKRQLNRLTAVGKWSKKMGKKFPTFARALGGIKKGIKKLGSGFWKYIMMAIGFFKSMLLPGMMSLVKYLPMMVIALGGKVLGGIGAAGRGLFGAARGLGGGGIMSGMGVAAGAGGLAMGAMDAIRAAKKAEEWKTSKAAAGIGGFLGGAEEQFSAKGAAKGVAKGAMIGAGIGSIVPVFGTAIGGVIGAIAGGILGFVGGQNIAKGIQFISDKIKSLAKSIWKFIMFPFRIMLKVIKEAKDKVMKTYKEKGVTGIVKLIGKTFINLITWPLRILKDAVEGAKMWAADKMEKIPVVGRLIKWIRGKKEKTIEAKAEEARNSIPMQRGGITKEAVRARLHPNEAVIPLPPGVAESVRSSILHPSELARRQAGYDVARTRAGVNPLLASEKATREQMGKATGATVASVNNVTNAISSSNQVINSASGGAGGIPAAGGRDYASQVILGDIS